MKNIKLFLILFVIILACIHLLRSYACARVANIDWKTLNEETTRLQRAGEYDRAVVVAKAALQVAEQNVGLEFFAKALGFDHPDVATSLENLAKLYRDTQRNTEAETLEKRAARIRAGNR